MHASCENRQPMPNPFTREQDAFKMLVVFMAGAAIVIAATLITGSSVGRRSRSPSCCSASAAAKLLVDYSRWRAESGRGLGG